MASSPTPGVGAWVVPHGSPTPRNRRYYSATQTTPSSPRIFYATQSLQRAWAYQGFSPGPPPAGLGMYWWCGGVFDEATDRVCREVQSTHRLTVDGLAGRKTALATYTPFAVEMEKAWTIPDHLVCGQILAESAFDPGAQGSYDSRDRGLAQINSRYHPDVSDEVAYGRSRFCINYVAESLAKAYADLRNWDAAVAYHNNPSKAVMWANTNSPPDEQIEEYVVRVRKAAASFPNLSP